MCFDKYSMYLYLKNHGVNTPLTFHELDDFKAAYFKGEIQFPVFIKPRTGSGSVGAHKVNTMQDLENYYAENAFDYIIQEFRDGEYYLSEINPRFGGAYLHAYGAGVDFFKLIINNINGVTNEVRIGDYDEGVLMLMYDDVVITKEVDLLRDYHD